MTVEIRPQYRERVKHIYDLVAKIEKEILEDDPEDIDMTYIAMILEEWLEEHNG